MPYDYKGFTLPVHYDKNWHTYVDPFFRNLIDKDALHTNNINDLFNLINSSQNIYIVEQYDEMDNIIYSLRTYKDDYVVYKVINDINQFKLYIATLSNNSTMTTKNIMWDNRINLVYSLI